MAAAAEEGTLKEGEVFLHFQLEVEVEVVVAHAAEVREVEQAAREVALREGQARIHQETRLKGGEAEETRLVVVVQLDEEPESHRI